MSISQEYTLAELPRITLYGVAAGAVSILAVVVPKVAFGIVIVRLLNMRNKKWQVWAVMAPSIFMVLYGVPGTIAMFLQCSPAPAQWNRMAYPNAKCLNPVHQRNYAISAGVFSTITDLFYAILPAVIVFRLKLDLRRKITVSVLMGLGVVAAAFSIYKTTLFGGILPAARSQAINSLLLLSIKTGLWTMIEANVLLLCACVPMLVPLLRLLREKGESLLGSYRSRTRSSIGSDETIASGSSEGAPDGSGIREKDQFHARDLEGVAKVGNQWRTTGNVNDAPLESV